MEGRSVVFFPLINGTVDRFGFIAVCTNAQGTAVVGKVGEALGKCCRVVLREGHDGEIQLN